MVAAALRPRGEGAWGERGAMKRAPPFSQSGQVAPSGHHSPHARVALSGAMTFPPDVVDAVEARLR